MADCGTCKYEPEWDSRNEGECRFKYTLPKIIPATVVQFEVKRWKDGYFTVDSDIPIDDCPAHSPKDA